jgi:hypothetical protein
VTNHRLDGGASLEVAFDRFGDAALLACGVDAEAVLRRCVVAAIAGVGDDALKEVADERIDRPDDLGERRPRRTSPPGSASRSPARASPARGEIDDLVEP